VKNDLTQEQRPPLATGPFPRDEDFHAQLAQTAREACGILPGPRYCVRNYRTDAPPVPDVATEGAHHRKAHPRHAGISSAGRPAVGIAFTRSAEVCARETRSTSLAKPGVRHTKHVPKKEVRHPPQPGTPTPQKSRWNHHHPPTSTQTSTKTFTPHFDHTNHPPLPSLHHPHHPPLRENHGTNLAKQRHSCTKAAREDEESRARNDDALGGDQAASYLLTTKLVSQAKIHFTMKSVLMGIQEK